jgi:hypothetical protein
MVEWIKLPRTVHRAAIAGKVVDGLDAQRALGGVVVTITAMPPASRALVAARGDRSVTAGDGVFSFSDLPDGAYTLSFARPEGSYGGATREVTVARDTKGDIALSMAVVPLPPTGVRGRVQGRVEGSPPSALPLSLARVRVRGSGERVYTDADGGFTLTGLEPGPRVLEIRASGHQSGIASASVALGSIVEIDDIILEPSS